MNSMPFRQLKSFFKILIGVQYELSYAIANQWSIGVIPFRGFPPVTIPKILRELSKTRYLPALSMELSPLSPNIR